MYRERWSHDKEVRTTHGVNCTGSCSWKVFVKNGVITWENQQTDYPSCGPDMPEYEPEAVLVVHHSLGMNTAHFELNIHIFVGNFGIYGLKH